MAMAAFKNIMNDLYSRNLRRNIQAALQARIENKQFCRGHAPYGYTVNRELKKLLPDENYADIVKFIFNEYLNNQNYESIARKLDEQGIPTPSARLIDRNNYSNGQYSTTWSASMLCQMITNPAYMGALSFAIEHKKSPYTQSRYRIPISEQTIIYDCHEAIIPREIWENVNQKYSEFQHKKMERMRENLYRGVLYCAHCGSSLKMNKGTSASSYYCKCWPVTSKTNISERTLKVSALDRYLTKEIHKIAVSIEDDNVNTFLYLSSRLEGAQHNSPLDKEVEAFQIQKRIDVINDKITNFDLYCKTRNFSHKEKQTVLSALNSSLENERQNLKRCEDTGIVKPTIEDMAHFIQKARKFGYIIEIDHEAVTELVDKIYVTRKENDSWYQQNRIKIKYKYIGQL